MENQSTLCNFDPTIQTDVESIESKELTEVQKIMDLLGRFTAQMLFEGMREGHPRPEWGGIDDADDNDCCNTWRFYYIDECRRRGIRLLEELGWSTAEDALYVNIHTGHIESLIDIVTQSGYYKDRIGDYVWSVVEHWEPHNPNLPNQYRIQYIKRNIGYLQERLSDKSRTKAEIKSDKNSLKEYQAKLERLENSG